MKRRSFLKLIGVTLVAPTVPVPTWPEYYILPDGRNFAPERWEQFVPKYWAQESQRILQENMVICDIVHKDFTDETSNLSKVSRGRDRLFPSDHYSGGHKS